MNQFTNCISRQDTANRTPIKIKKHLDVCLTTFNLGNKRLTHAKALGDLHLR